MKRIIFGICILISFCYCSNPTTHRKTDGEQQKFDKAKWTTKEGKDYPYRDEILNDLVYNVKLKGLKRNEVIDLLGQPDRIDSSYLFYMVSQQRIGFFPLHTRTLVIRLAADSTVEWRKIHE